MSNRQKALLSLRMQTSHKTARNLTKSNDGKYHDNLAIAMKLTGMYCRILKIDDINWIMENVPHEWVDLQSVKELKKDDRYYLTGGFDNVKVHPYYGKEY